MAISTFQVLSKAKTAHWAFSTAQDGDLRSGDRARFSSIHGAPGDWAATQQVHGTQVVVVDEPGDHGPADALITGRRDLPLAMFTADCLGIVFEGNGLVGVAHCGWRGVHGGIIEAVLHEMDRLGSPARSAMSGPGIRACCFEVGPDVEDQFPGAVAETSWGTTSVDLVRDVSRRLGDVVLTVNGDCTMCGNSYFSYRNGDMHDRMVTLAWLS